MQYGKRRSVLVHRLVAEAFLPLPDRLDMQLHHKDFQKHNNSSENLEWLSVADHTKNFTFTPEKTDSFKTAQVCAGGIGSDEVYPDTLMSRKTNGLYICGEMLNVDGDCGGYNLHFSFGSGIMAAKNIK